MLTDAAIRRIKPREKAFKVADAQGLYLLIQPNGSRYWRMDYRHGEKRGTTALGVYPEVSLKEAREKRQNAKKLLEKGVNPSAFKKLTRGVGKITAGDSFKTVADEFVAKAEAEGRAKRTLEKLRWLLAFAEPILGPRPVGDITAPEVLTVLRIVEVRGRYESARRLRSTISSVIRFAVATGRAERDVTVDLKGALIAPKVKSHAAIIEPHKVGQLLRAIAGYDGQPAVAIALRMAPHVFVRPGELRSAEWTEIDLEKRVWTIPGEKMKMGRSHRVPLSRQVIALLEELRPITGTSKLLFPSVRSNDRSISDNTINAALRRLGYDSSQMTGHGFRSTASTLLNETRKWHADAIERQLAHVEMNDVRRAYLRGEHWDERVRMMQYWSDYLEKLKSGSKTLRRP